MKERWKPVAGYKGRYEVSDHGRVRSLARLVLVFDNAHRKPYKKPVRGRILSAGRSEYLTASLWKANSGTTVYIHDLVAAAFIGKKPKGWTVNHKDLDKRNAHWLNLEYTTYLGNALHAAAHGALTFARPVARSDGESYHSMRAASLALNVSRGAVWEALRLGTRVRGYEFKYLDIK